MQVLDLAKEREPAYRVGVGERRQEQPPEQVGQHSHRQKKAGLAAHPARPVERYPTARHNHVEVRVMASTPTIPGARIMFRSSTPFTRFTVLPCRSFADRSAKMGRSVSWTPPEVD